MTRWWPTADGVRILAVALVLAGIVHICVTFAMPSLTGSRALRQFVASLATNRLDLLPPIAPGNQPLPFMSPDARLAVCRFDTSLGPVAVTVNLPDVAWVLALYNMEGDNFYHVIGQPGKRIALSLLLVPPSEQAIGASETQTTVAGAPVLVPARQGLLVIRAPERGAAYRQEVETELRASRCAVRRPAPGQS